MKYLLPDGPADRAGLKVGNIITGVDGKSASVLTLSGLREMLRNGTPGSQVKFVLGKGERARTVTFVLQRFIARTEALKKTD